MRQANLIMMSAAMLLAACGHSVRSKLTVWYQIFFSQEY